jgi:hypothetical protein
MRALIVAGLAMVAAIGVAQAAPADPQPAAPPAVAAPVAAQAPVKGQEGKDVIWWPTPDSLVQMMLKTANVTDKDYVVDLGAGDGKIVIAAARDFGARALGLEYNPDLVAFARKEAEKAGVSDKAKFERADIFKTDFSNADVVTMYLLSTLNMKLRPTLLKMKPGTRIVSNSFDLGDWDPDQKFESEGYNGYYWVVPADVQGRWSIALPGAAAPADVRLKQRFQKVDGYAQIGKARASVTNAKLVGTDLSFTVVDAANKSWAVSGKVMAGRFVGAATQEGGASAAVTATRR